MIRFFDYATATGETAGGIPIYRDVTMIEIARSAANKITIAATDKHRREHAQAYADYETKRTGRDVDGFPLMAWPGVSPAERAMCDAAGIYSVEALAETALDGAPNAIVDASKRARAFLATVGGADTERAERIETLEAEVAALKEENAALKAAAKQAKK